MEVQQKSRVADRLTQILHCGLLPKPHSLHAQHRRLKVLLRVRALTWKTQRRKGTRRRAETGCHRGMCVSLGMRACCMWRQRPAAVGMRAALDAAEDVVQAQCSCRREHTHTLLECPCPLCKQWQWKGDDLMAWEQRVVWITQREPCYYRWTARMLSRKELQLPRHSSRSVFPPHSGPSLQSQWWKACCPLWGPVSGLLSTGSHSNGAWTIVMNHQMWMWKRIDV